MNKRIVKNASWIIACRVIQSLINLVISMISARYLGPANYGLISYAASMTAFLVPVVQLGLRNTLVQEIIDSPEKEGETLGTALFISTAASLLGIVGIVSFVSIVNRGEIDTIIVCGLYSVSLIFQMTEMIQYWFQAKLLSKYTAVTSLIAYVLVSIYKVILLMAGKNIYWFAVAGSLDYLLITASLFCIYQKVGTKKITVSFSWAKKLFQKSKHYIVSGMMVAIFAQTDRIMLKLMIGEEVTGFYAAAVTCAGMSGFVFAAIIDSFRPIIFEYKKKNEEAYSANLTRLYSIIIYLGLLQSVVFACAAPLIISLFYGIAYAPATPVLQIVTWYTTFSYIGSVRNIWILAEEKQRILWIVNLSGAMLNIAGNVLLIPVLGASGAAMASVATQIFTNFVLCFIIKPIRSSAKLILAALDPKVLIQMIRPEKKGN